MQPTFWTRIGASLAAIGQPADVRTKAALAAAGVAVDSPVSAEDAAQFAAEDAEAREAREHAQIARRRQAGKDAETFIESVAGKIVPAMRQPLSALFARLAEDDADAAVVTFGPGEEGEGGRVDALRALFANLPGHDLTRDRIDAGARLLPTETPETDGLAEATILRYLGMTPLGAEIAAARAAKE